MEEGGKKEGKGEDEAQKKAMEEGGKKKGGGEEEAPKGPMEEEGGDSEGEEEGGGEDEAPKGPMEEEGGDSEGEEEGGGQEEAPKGPMEEEGGDGEGEQEPVEEEGGDSEGEAANPLPLPLPMKEGGKRKGTMEVTPEDVKRMKMDGEGEGERKRHIYQLNQPLSDEIMRETLPENFRHPHNLPKFRDFSNPEHHLNEYLAHASLQNLSNGICCKLFLTTLSSTALSLFYKLPPRSIHNFQDLADAFVNDFAFNAKFYPTTIDKLRITQSRDRSVEDYISDVMEKVHGLAVRPQFREILTLIMNGLRDGLFTSFKMTRKVRAAMMMMRATADMIKGLLSILIGSFIIILIKGLF